MKQFELFGDANLTPKKNNKLVISKSKNKILSKEQTTFNKHSAKIEALRKQLKNDEVKYEKLSAHFQTNVLPVYEEHANSLIDFVKHLFEIFQTEKLSSKHRDTLSKLILSNLSDAFQHVVPTDEVKSIYDTFSEISFDEEEAEQFNLMKDSLGDMFSDMFGMDVDFSDINKDMKEEDIMRKMAELKETVEKQLDEESQQQKKKKKTKKELESEIKQKQTEELQKKNIRAIYTSLAKILHPDLETDEHAKLEKEELMKQVTNAYQAKDLHELLKLEIEIIHKQSENLDHLTNEKLKIINAVLKEQIDEINYEIEMLHDHPKYEKISDYMFLNEKQAIQEMNSLIDLLNRTKIEIAEDIRHLKGKNKVNFLVQMLRSSNQPKSFNEFMPDIVDEASMMNVLEMLKSMGLGKNHGKPKGKSKSNNPFNF